MSENQQRSDATCINTACCDNFDPPIKFPLQIQCSHNTKFNNYLEEGVGGGGGEQCLCNSKHLSNLRISFSFFL